MDRLIVTVERIAGACLGVVVVLTFATVVLRDFLSIQIPDWFLFACFAQGIAIFWGLASTTYHNRHILVDVLWEASGVRGRRWIDIAAAIVTAVFLTLFAWMAMVKAGDTFRSNQLTADLRLAVWPFHLVAALGIVATAILAVLRLWRVMTRAEPSAQ